ncbi:hypothetical protein TGAM01_v203057 [Trichoderma gamsii]|uniref:Uncharacterized protein n=1 Tax=Trichoderma gamsii TaxID=398673 RepID=A0A2P4ZUG6_9HYPO|nr:hypothetical protein TGAM01_v203057 [Trichoderma gamsii]PON27920.1 hypothetical protein TGAM01_v203057 [Trichoderma gamsii]
MVASDQGWKRSVKGEYFTNLDLDRTTNTY